MRYFLYDILFHIFFIAGLPYHLYRAAGTGRYRKGLAERFGRLSAEKTAAVEKGRPRIWIHAVSVGETKAVMPLARLLKERMPSSSIVFSTTTDTGRAVAEKEAGGLVDAFMYCPLDFSWAVGRAAEKLAPDMLIVVEKEVWPNLYRAVKKRGAPVVVVNGTISERSFRRYKKAGRLFSGLFEGIDFYCAATEADLERALALGVAPERARVFGNIKFDLEVRVDDRAVKTLEGALGKGGAVITAGSTHGGEEEVIIDVFKKLSLKFKSLKLILAPRHPERFGAVAALLKKSGLDFTRRTEGGRADIILLDTIGELTAAYSLSDVAFVGGSLAEGVGGHNLLEPAALARPVLYGPHLAASREMARLLEEGGGGIRVKGAEDLFLAMEKLLSDGGLKEEVGKKALSVVEKNRGAMERTLSVVERLLSPEGL